MKKIDNISNKLSVSDIAVACGRAFKHHSGKSEVIAFKKDFEANCQRLYERLMDGCWKADLSYRPMRIKNNDGKLREIESPSLVTRIYQHLLLNLLEPVYESKDNGNGFNCKPGYGITAKDRRKSVVHRLKHAYYDRLDLHYALIIDQRKCYEHVTASAFRRVLRRMVSDKWLVDFAVDVSFINGVLPIGTPTSPFIHNLLMLPFDYFAKDMAAFALRYADNNFLAFHTLEEAQAAKWRVKNYWWYELGIRAKLHQCAIIPMDDTPCDFCGYVFRRNGKGIAEHDKGYVRARETLADRARRCRSDASWASYFGQLMHADAFSLMQKIEKKMKLRELTEKIRIDRQMDARNIEIRELLGLTITIYDYEIRYNSQKQPNWIKCLVGYDEVIDGEKTGKILAREFHGNYQGIIQFISACEKQFGKKNLLPLEDVEIENQCGYIFKGSTNQLTYIEP